MCEPTESVPLQPEENVPVREFGHSFSHKRIKRQRIEEFAIQKWRASGIGITYVDVEHLFSVKKSQAQRSLKHLHRSRVLFTARDLIRQGINLIPNKSPQAYFPTCIKSDIIENLKKRSAPVKATGVNPQYLSNNLDLDKVQSFLDLLKQIPFAPLYIHKLLLLLSIAREYYQELVRQEGRRNKGKVYKEVIGRRLVTYTLSPNGTVEIAVRSNDTPFRLESEEDECEIFSFLGQVRDRLLYIIKDVNEVLLP